MLWLQPVNEGSLVLCVESVIDELKDDPSHFYTS